MADARSYSKLGAKLSDLRHAWKDRLSDAEILLAAGGLPAAIASGLYAIEIRLKVRICERLDLLSLPKPFEVHDLEGLLILLGLSRAIDRKDARGVKRNWGLVLAMSLKINDHRYGTKPHPTEEEARAFFSQLRDAPHGVLTWLSNQD